MNIKEASCRTCQWIYNIGEKMITWKLPKRIEGVDSFMNIPEILELEEVKCPMIVTGPRIAQCDFLQSLLDDLPEEAVLFDQVTPDPTISLVEEIVSLYYEKNCDGFIAVGGGSNMDAAKAAAARIARPDKTLVQLGGQLKVHKTTPLLIAVPTTAGTGSETTIAAVVTDDSCNRKYAINDIVLVPDYAVLDPALTVSLPPALTASTGMDALTHAVEAYLGWTYQTKDTLKFAKEATEAIVEYLPVAYQEGDNLQAREEMLRASFKAGAAFTRASVGNVHAIAHTIGGLYHVSHGLANAVVLPIVLEDYGSAAYERLAELAGVCELCKDGTVEEKAKAFINRIKEMNQEMGIPETLDMIRKEDIPTMAKWADREANPLYPVPVVYDQKHFCKVIAKVAGLEQ